MQLVCDEFRMIFNKSSLIDSIDFSVNFFIINSVRAIFKLFVHRNLYNRTKGKCTKEAYIIVLFQLM